MIIHLPIFQFYSWLWSPAPTASHQHNRRFGGSIVPVWPRVCPRERDDSSVWEWWSVDPQLRRCHLQPQTHTLSDFYSCQWEWCIVYPVHLGVMLTWCLV